jgi:hypothetical protein
MNLGDSDVNFTIVDQNAQTGVSHTIGSHAIHTYRWKPTARAADQLANTSKAPVDPRTLIQTELAKGSRAVPVPP